MTPYSTPERVPKSKTGPATVKILAPTPRMSPSLLVSMAGETTAFAKPVTGTRVPAPAKRAIRSNSPSPVSRADKKISETVATNPASSGFSPQRV